VILRASDTHGGFSTQSFVIALRLGDTPPAILSKPPTQATVGRLYQYAVHAVDQDGDPLTYALAVAPDGMTIDPSSGVIRWAPAAGQVGSQHVVIEVDDQHGGGTAQSYDVIVSAAGANQPPTINSTPVFMATVNQPYAYQARASDPEGDSLQFSLINAPAGMVVDPNSGLAVWTPSTAQLGRNSVLLAVTDSVGNVATQKLHDHNPVREPPARDQLDACDRGGIWSGVPLRCRRRRSGSRSDHLRAHHRPRRHDH